MIEQQAHNQRHQYLARRTRQSLPLWNLRCPGNSWVGEQIELQCHWPACHRDLPDASREDTMLRAELMDPKLALPPASDWLARSARRYPRKQRLQGASLRRPRGRTSTPVSQDSDRWSHLSGCSGKRPNPFAPQPHEHRLRGKPRDAMGTELPEHGSRGRYVAALYNHVRPHSSLGNRTPAQARRAFEQNETITPDALVQAQGASYLTAGLSL